MIPFETIMIPLYIVVTSIGLQDTYQGLIVPFLISAFGVFLMRQTLLAFPDELLDAARIDGASEFGIFWRIVLPNAVPAMAVLGVLTFQGQWDNLIWPLLVVQSDEPQDRSPCTSPRSPRRSTRTRARWWRWPPSRACRC
jgi:multiple sugar transport system permease protein